MTIVTNAPDRVGRYRITGVIGEGASGVVYKAFDTSLQRVVAVKVLHRSLPPEARAAQAFAARLREQAQAIARLAHPNIVTLHEIDEAGGRPFIAMAHAAGVDVDRWLAARPLPSQAVLLQVMDQLLDALQSAHVAGMRHGDLKAGNVIVGPANLVKITDFGLARAEGRAGTTAGAAPEYQAGRALDHRVDLYAAGVLLYRMLAGREPFAGDVQVGASPSTVLRAPSTFPEARRPADFDAVVAKAMARDPSMRYASAAEFRGALHEATELRLPVHGTRMLTLAPPGPEPVTSAAAGAAAKRSGAFAVRQSLAPPAAPDVGAAGAVPTLTIAIPDSVLAMPSFDPWARPVRMATVVSDGLVAARIDVASSSRWIAPGPGYVAFRDSAALAATAALDAAASAADTPGAATPRPVAPVMTAPLTLPPSRTSPVPGGLVISSPVASPRAPGPHVLPPVIADMPASEAGIPAEALRRVLKVLAVHVGSQASSLLRQVAGRAATLLELHALLLEEAGDGVDVRKLGKQLNAIARLPL